MKKFVEDFIFSKDEVCNSKEVGISEKYFPWIFLHHWEELWSYHARESSLEHKVTLNKGGLNS